MYNLYPTRIELSNVPVGLREYFEQELLAQAKFGYMPTEPRLVVTEGHGDLRTLTVIIDHPEAVCAAPINNWSGWFVTTVGFAEKAVVANGFDREIAARYFDAMILKVEGRNGDKQSGYHPDIRFIVQRNQNILYEEMAAPTNFVFPKIELVGFGLRAIGAVDTELAKLMKIEGTQYPWTFNGAVFTFDKKYGLPPAHLASFASQILAAALKAEPENHGDQPRKVILWLYDRAHPAPDNSPTTLCEMIEGQLFNPIRFTAFVSDKHPDEIVQKLQALVSAQLAAAGQPAELELDTVPYPALGLEALRFKPTAEIAALPLSLLTEWANAQLALVLEVDPVRDDENDGKPNKIARRIVINGGDKRALNWERDHDNVIVDHLINEQTDVTAA